MSISAATPAPVTSLGTTTSYLPLTTTFPSVAFCSSMFVNPNNNGDTRLYAFDPGYAIHNTTAPTCMPDAAKLWWYGGTSGIVTTEIGGFSTMACPAMFTTALIQPHNSTTLIACCPSNYDFVALKSGANPAQCSSVMPKGQEVTFVQMDAKGSWITTSHAWTADSLIYGVQVNGYIFNGAVATAKSSSSSSGSTGPGTTAATSSGASSSSTSSDTGTPHTSSDLSAGAKAGIGIGAGLGIVGILSLLVTAFLFRRRKNAAPKMQLQSEASDMVEGRSKLAWQHQELPAQVVHQLGGSHEVDSQQRYETPMNRSRSEMP